MPRRARIQIRLRVFAVAAFTALLGALLPVADAHAAARTVQGGRLDWGVKSSFQSYLTGPIAKGSYSLTGGAATVGASQFRFHSARGSYDGSTGAFSSSFSGGVHFVGHKKSDGSYELDMTISNPTVRIAGGAGTLYVDVVSRAKGTGAVTSSRQVPFASLSLGGIDMKGDEATTNTVTLNNLPATLTSQGARSFAGYYTAGTALDPVTLSADVAPKRATPSATATKKAESKKEEAKQDASGEVRDGAVDWGVRRTFREYVTGDIAQGEWNLGGGARDGGALFRFPKGEGTYDKKKQSLDAEFTGSVRFTGKHGLDLRLGGVTVSVDDGKGTLRADVTSGGRTAEGTALVTFKAGALAAKGGLVEVSEAPATLTAAGAKAFGGMYQAGAAMDPVSVAVALDADAKLPALPDLGESASPGPSTSPSVAAKSAAAAVSSRSGIGGGAVAGLVAAVVVVLAGAGFLVVRSRRKA